MNGINGNANPWVGGSITRNSPPTSLGGSIPPANTSVANPAAGVTVGEAKTALNNSTSNIGIPYSRIVPNFPKRYKLTKVGSGDSVMPTDDLRATTIAFVQGVVANKNTPELRTNPNAPPPYMQDMAPGMVGTERFQQLCSIEYLQAHFEKYLAGQTIDLSEAITDVGKSDYDQMMRSVDTVLGTVWLSSDSTSANNKTKDRKLKLMSAKGVPDLALWLREAGDVDAGANHERDLKGELYQGIFTRDVGPFLRGKGATQAMVLGNAREPYKFDMRVNTTKKRKASPGAEFTTFNEFTMRRCLGDDLAFAYLHHKMDELGLMQWKPDGLVLSKGVNDPSDAEVDNFIDARDGQLYNIRVQGPAIASSWCNVPEMEVMPLDKLFVVIVADAWFDPYNLPGEVLDKIDGRDLIGTWVRAKQNGDKEGMNTYHRIKDSLFDQLEESSLPRWDHENGVMVDNEGGEWYKHQLYAMQGKESPILTNFRVQLATSSQVYNYSAPSFRGGKQQAGPSFENLSRGDGRSRMGLRLSQHVGEYIIGGWMVGNVLDTSASRAAFPGSGNVGVRTAPNSMALNVNVQVDFWSADRMWHTFMNVDGSVMPRFKKRVSKRSIGDLRSKFNKDPLHDTDAVSRTPLGVDDEREEGEEEREEESEEEY